MTLNPHFGPMLEAQIPLLRRYESMGRLVTISVLLLTLSACAPARRVTWVPPDGVSGRDAIRDKAVCRENSGAREAMLTSGGGGLAGALFDAEAYQIVKTNFTNCMIEAGYRPR